MTSHPSAPPDSELGGTESDPMRNPASVKDRISLAEWAWLITVAITALGSALFASRQGWVPVGDDAVVVTRAADIATKSPPLLGMPTSLILDTGELTYHPGPLLFGWLSPFVLIFGRVTGGALGAAALNLTAIAASWWFVRSISGRRFGIFAGTLCVLIASSFVPVYQPLNSSLSACVTFAVFASAWAVLMRIPHSIYSLIFFASMAAQSHIGYAVVALSVATPIVAWDLVRRWRSALPTPDQNDSGSGRRITAKNLIGSVAATAPVLAVTVGLWIPPLLDSSRNMVRLVLQADAGIPSRGLGEGFATTAAVLGKFPIRVSGTVGDYNVPTPLLQGVDVLFTGKLSIASLIFALLGLALLGSACSRGDRATIWGSVVLAFGTVGVFVGTALLPLRAAIDVQVYWARCLSLFALLLYVVAARAILRSWKPQGFALSRAGSIATAVVAIAVVALIGSRSLDVQWAQAPERALAQEMVTTLESANAIFSDEKFGLSARGGVVTPGAVAAEQAMFGLTAARIEADKPTVLSAFWYWGSDRQFIDAERNLPVILVSPRPVPTDLPSDWTELAHVEATALASPDFSNRLAEAVAESDESIVLAPHAPDILPTVVDGTLPGGCEDPNSWLENPSRFITEAPDGLVELYRAGLILEPELPADIQEELWQYPLTGLWAYEIDQMDTITIDRNDSMVLNRITCDQ